MTTTELSAHANRMSPEWNPLATIDDAEGIQERFLESFTQLMEQKKIEAIQSVLSEELPLLAGNEDFIQKTAEKLGHEIVKEKRFVFLAVNPRFKQ